MERHKKKQNQNTDLENEGPREKERREEIVQHEPVYDPDQEERDLEIARKHKRKAG